MLQALYKRSAFKNTKSLVIISVVLTTGVAVYQASTLRDIYLSEHDGKEDEVPAGPIRGISTLKNLQVLKDLSKTKPVIKLKEQVSLMKSKVSEKLNNIRLLHDKLTKERNEKLNELKTKVSDIAYELTVEREMFLDALKNQLSDIEHKLHDTALLRDKLIRVLNHKENESNVNVVRQGEKYFNHGEINSNNINNLSNLNNKSEDWILYWLNLFEKIHRSVSSLRNNRSYTNSSSSSSSSEKKRKINLILVGDSLVSGVGCSSETGPVLPRLLASILSNALGVDVSWRAHGIVGGTVAQLRHEVLPIVQQEMNEHDNNATTTTSNSSSSSRSWFFNYSTTYNTNTTNSNSNSNTEVTNIVLLIVGLNDFKTVFTEFPLGSGPNTFRQQLGSLADDLQIAAEQNNNKGIVYVPAIPVQMAEGTSLQQRPLKYFVDAVAYLWDLQKQAIGNSDDNDNNNDNNNNDDNDINNNNDSVGYIGMPSDTYVDEFISCTSSEKNLIHFNGNISNIITRDSLISGDGVHPSANGYRLWACHLANSIIETLVSSN